MEEDKGYDADDVSHKNNEYAIKILGFCLYIIECTVDDMNGECKCG